MTLAPFLPLLSGLDVQRHWNFGLVAFIVVAGKDYCNLLRYNW